MKTDRQIQAETRFQFYSSPSESSSKATYYKDWPVFLIHAVSTCVSSVPCVPLCFRLSPLFLPRVPETFLARIPGISGSAVNGTRFVGSSHWKIPRKSGKSKKVGRFPGGGGGTAIYRQYRSVPLRRVWFSISLLYKSERLGLE